MQQAAAAQATAQAAQAAGDVAGAAAAWEAVARLESTCAAAEREVGQERLALGQDAPTIVAWDRALLREPGDWQTRARLAAYSRDHNAAKRATSLLRAVPPTFNAKMLDWAWAGLGVAAPLTVTVGWDDIGWVRGFQIGEDAADGPAFRWAGPEAESAVRLAGSNAAGRTLRLVMHSLPPPAPAPPTRPVTVTANGRVLARLDVAPTWTTYTLPLPADLPPAPDLVVTFTSPPQRASLEDPRRLSFALQSAALGP
jgi:hypothetical protein